MKKLALYRDGLAPWAEVELATPLDRDTLEDTGSRNEAGDFQGRKCERCNLSARVGVRTPCMDAVSFGGGGGLLVIGDAPTRDDDIAGVPFTSRAGKNIRRIVKQYWRGPIAFDYAVKCAPAATKLKDRQARECRGYLLSTIEAVRPTRIITLGPWAAFSVLGRSVPPMQSRRTFAWLRGEGLGYGPIAVFMGLRPSDAERNRFVNGWLEEDMKHALTSPDPPRGPWGAEVHIIETEADALAAEADLMTNDWVSFDVETMGRMWNPEFRMMSCSVCGDGDEEPYAWDEAALYNPKTRAPLERVLASRRVAKMGKVGSNVKYDQLAFRAAFGLRVHPIVGDTRLSRKLLDPEAAGALAAMAELVGMGGMKEDAKDRMAEVKSKLKSRVRKQWHPKKPLPLVADEPLLPGFALHPEIDAALRAASPTELDDVAETYQYGMIPHDELVVYNARDAVATARVEHYVRERLPLEPSLERVWNDIVLPGTIALERVECWGIAASMGAITSFDRLLTAKEQVIGTRLAVYPGINWDSPDQVAALLFDTLKLPIIKRTPGGKPSTDEEVLDLLKSKHPLCSDLLEWRSVSKLKGTYASGMIPHVRVDGRIHPNIKLDGARSGRTSCTDPNLQNIPRPDSDEGKMARDCFVAPPGKMLFEADFSQLELRIAAMLSGDPVMLEIFAGGIDYHLRTAQMISRLAWGIAPEEVTDKHRSLAKSVNFGILYGKTARTLAEEWGVSTAKAQQVVDAIMGTFKVLDKWCKARRSEAEKTGFVWTWWKGQQARKRPLYRIAEKGNDGAMVTARNGAVNSPVQGTASEFCIASLIDAVDWIEGDGIEDDVKLVLAVHDSLLFEVTASMVDELAGQVNEIMTGHDSNGVPLGVDFKSGTAWGSMKKYKLAA